MNTDKVEVIDKKLQEKNNDLFNYYKHQIKHYIEQEELKQKQNDLYELYKKIM